MLKALLLSLTLALAVMATAQNLVVNGSFEDTVNCEVPTQCTLLKAEHWYNPNLATPDLFDADLDRLCGYAMNPNQPTTFMEPQEGSRLAGAYLWDGPTGSIARDYLMTKLVDALDPGLAYVVSLWYARRRPHKYAVDHIGIWIGHDSLFETTVGRLDVEPQVKLRDPYNTYLVNGDAWTQLTDTFVAVGGERWLVIGNFDHQDSVEWIVADPLGIYGTSYYYIDQIQLSPLEGLSVNTIQPFVTWWNGYGMEFQWDKLQGPVFVELFDAMGRHLRQDVVYAMDGHGAFAVGYLPAGIYMVVVRSGAEHAAVKFVKGEGGF